MSVGRVEPTAIAVFAAVLLSTLAITWWAARRTHTAADFYTAGASITGLQNGLAMAGDYLSAAAFLGISALVFAKGFDGLVYSVGFLVGWPVLVFLVAERLRTLGRFTFADVLAARLDPRPIRIFASATSLIIIAFYLIAQMVGAGQLIELLFGIDYTAALVVVGTLMIVYVSFGGMLATTWVQIVKATLLLSVSMAMALMVLARFRFDIDALVRSAVAVAPLHAAILGPIDMAASPWSTVSLAMALMFGTAGLPHILMRFFTVPDVRQARISVLCAATCVATFSLLTFAIGFGAIVLVGGDARNFDRGHRLIGGANMLAIHLANTLGGGLLEGIVAAVAFATILAVVAGLALSCVSTIAHDLYANVIRTKAPDGAAELRLSRWVVPMIGALAVGLGLVFARQNVAYMVALAFAVAASSNFPVLLLALYWRGLTTKGAILGGTLGLVCAVGLTVLGPGVWVTVLGHATPVFPLANPALVSMPLAFLGCWAGSRLIPSGARAT